MALLLQGAHPGPVGLKMGPESLPGPEEGFVLDEPGQGETP
jgi:hypothetical protein